MASPKRAQFQLAAAHTDHYALGGHCFCSSSSFAFTCWRRSIAKLFRINHYSFSLPFFPGICQSVAIWHCADSMISIPVHMVNEIYLLKINSLNTLYVI